MQLDLNLLTVLDALLEEVSVTGAARRLHLSAPAVSRSLGRIRAVTGDQILVRTGRSMTPTPYALVVREQVHLLIQQATAVLAPHRDLDLSTVERVFTLQCHDSVTSAVAPTLLAAVRAEAPGVTLRFLPEAAHDTDELRHGRVDIEVGATRPTLPEIRFATLGSSRLCVVTGPLHPLVSGVVTPASYAAADHVIVSRRGRLRDPVDDVLARHGLRRRVVATAPTSSAAVEIVGHTGAVAVVARDACRTMIDALGLRTVALPFDVPPVPVVAAWHQRYDADPAHAWLRAQLREAITQALVPGGP